MSKENIPVFSTKTKFKEIVIKKIIKKDIDFNDF